MAENDSNMIDLVFTHLTHPWGPPWTLATLGDMLENYHFGDIGHFQALFQATFLLNSGFNSSLTWVHLKGSV